MVAQELKQFVEVQTAVDRAGLVEAARDGRHEGGQMSQHRQHIAARVGAHVREPGALGRARRPDAGGRYHKAGVLYGLDVPGQSPDVLFVFGRLLEPHKKPPGLAGDRFQRAGPGADLRIERFHGLAPAVERRGGPGEGTQPNLVGIVRVHLAAAGAQRVLGVAHKAVQEDLEDWPCHLGAVLELRAWFCGKA